MDPISVLCGATLVWAASAWGSWRERKKKPKPPAVIQPICGCEHHYAKHDETGCQVTWTGQVLMERGKPKTLRTGFDGSQHKVVYELEKYEKRNYACSCKRYTGPEPLPTYYDPRED